MKPILDRLSTVALLVATTLPLLAFRAAATDFSGTYALQPENKKSVATNTQLVILQTDSSIQFVHRVGEKTFTEVFPLDGSEVPYSTETGAQGKASAHWHGSELIVETKVPGRVPAGSVIYFVIHNTWKLSPDGSSLKDHIVVAAPNMSADIVSAAFPPSDVTYKRTSHQ